MPRENPPASSTIGGLDVREIPDIRALIRGVAHRPCNDAHYVFDGFSAIETSTASFRFTTSNFDFVMREASSSLYPLCDCAHIANERSCAFASVRIRLWSETVFARAVIARERRKRRDLCARHADEKLAIVEIEEHYTFARTDRDDLRDTQRTFARRKSEAAAQQIERCEQRRHYEQQRQYQRHELGRQ
jgi:hypothetical protein